MVMVKIVKAPFAKENKDFWVEGVPGYSAYKRKLGSSTNHRRWDV